MSKIFRLYTGGTNTYQDWNNSPTFPYDSKSRDTIEDPEGASAKNEITSIPSPFARIDLVKNAFKEVCKPDKNGTVDLNGTTIFHKMVSDTLDVAEIFFNIDRFQDKVEIIKWDKLDELKELQESKDNVGHRYLGDALDKYLEADKKTYNFDQLKGIYLLNYKGENRKEALDIIGATSPATLFFSNANDLSYIKDISFGQDKPFDSEYQPLYKRDFELVKYLFALRDSIGHFAKLFPEVNSYLDETLKAIANVEKQTLSDITKEELKKFSQISVRNAKQDDIVEVLGYTLYGKDTSGQPAQSDFIIKSSTNTTKLQPLVLPTIAGNTYADLQYVTDKWGRKHVAPPYDDQIDLSMRKLPDVGNQYPYLTISDFLEDYIICVPHTMNSQSYFDGNISSKISNNKKKAYLLPIKPLFFNYFTIEELKGSMPGGKPMLEMEMLAGEGVKATLRIPIKGNENISYIEYDRMYFGEKANIDKNDGGIKELKFTGFIMPQVKFSNVDDAIYNVSCVQDKSGKVTFSFFKSGENIGSVNSLCRDSTSKHAIKAENYFLEKRDFDCIQVTDNIGHCGMMIPIFKEQKNIDSFEFAVDLGTSNTHIEYKKSEQNNSSEFSFTADDRQLCEMFSPTFDREVQIDLMEETELIEKDFIPAVIGKGDFHFPTRTVLSHSETTDWNDNIEPYTLVNLPFTYGKRRELPYNRFRSDIKWGKEDELNIMEAYIRCLMLIMRNKVLLNNGDLSKTKVTWFYPNSMPKKRLNSMEEKWNSAYKKYFGRGETLKMTESAAPMSYLFDKHSTASDLVNIDIGGGTTDIAFAKDKVVQYVTSFRFAANTLFEDSFAPINNNNGIIDYHKGKILKLLQEKKLNELVSVFNSSDNENPANMASFLFSLKNNSFIKEKQINVSSIDFNHILREDENFKIVFILFYTAIIYHIAQIVKVKDLELPRHISFSGNGSKVVRVITKDLNDLADYTKLIFKKVVGKEYKKKLELLGLEGESNPKESTCKGGIRGGAEEEGSKCGMIVLKSDCSGIVEKETYKDVNDTYKERTIKATKDFFKFALEVIPNEFDLKNQFGVTKKSLEIALEEAKEDLETFLNNGIDQRRDEVDNDDVIDETFFFYPIKGVLPNISGKIYESLQNDEKN